MARDAAVHVRMTIPPAPWTWAMEEGRVQVPGLTWTCSSDMEQAPDRFDALEAGIFDVGENGVRRLSLKLLKGAPSTGVPVFFGREHMQRNVLVRSDSPLTHPRELVGKRVGSRLTAQSGTSAGVLMMLEQAYGLPLAEVDWRLGDGTLPVNRMGLKLSTGPDTDAEIFAQLRSGEIDAAIVTLSPRYWSLFGPDRFDHRTAAPGDIRPLLNAPATIADAYRRTGLYPITDLMVVSPQLAQNQPHVLPKLVTAFAEANALASDYRSPEENQLAQREIELLGEDPHQYGLTPKNRKNIAAFIDFLYRLGALERPLAPEQLFAPSSLSA